jgi:formate/nitrite transporter FocA (FNT family)
MADILDERGEPMGAAGLAAPELSEEEKKEARERTSISAPVVHEAIRRDGDEELQRPVSALAWSGLAAGLSMGFSFVVEGLLHHYLPESKWSPLVVSMGYPFGFLLIIIGRQQLFTENTLTAVIPLLARRNIVTLIAMLRLWAIVLVANLVGAHLFAWVVAKTPMFPAEFQPSFHAIAIQAADVSFWTAILRGIFAGWLIAMVVWMLAAVDSGRIAIIVILTYVVGLARLTHIIAGSVEVLYLVMAGERNWFVYLGGYMAPTLIGNILGGVALVSALNHAQVVAGMPRRRIPSQAKSARPA